MKQAAGTTPSEDLVYNYPDIEAKLTYRVRPSVDVFVHIGTLDRFTNLEDETFSTGRDYITFTALAGVTIDLYSLIKPEEKRTR